MAERVPMTQLEIPDYDLGLRGKLLRAEKVASPGLAMCTIVYGLSLADEVTDTPFSNAGNGYPDAAVEIDPGTHVELPWRPGTTAVIGDLTGPDGLPHPASARGRLRSLELRYAELGLSPVLGFEYEMWVYVDGRHDAARDVTALPPLGATQNAYSLSRSAEVASLADAFIDRMEAIGAPVEAFHSELGPGFFEFAMKPQPAVRAADGAARARQYFRDLCAERGLKASFMAKPYRDRSGAGGHVHSSICRAGDNVFSAGPGRLSAEGEHYLAGLVDTAAECTLLFNPFVNSFKRLDREMFVAEDASWGYDDRSVTCRVILDTVPGARVEHRRPGADVSPYLAATGLLAGGLIGLEGRLPLRPSSRATATDVSPTPPRDPEPLPQNLAQAIERFQTSDRLAAVLGKEFVQAFADTRCAERDRYDRWLGAQITQYELTRHLEHL